MTKYLIIILSYLVLHPSDYLFAQADTLKFDGVEVIVPSTGKKKNNTYFLISSGYQLPSCYRVPMIPEISHNMEVRDNMYVKVPGWFAGIGIVKRTRSRFEFGILANYYETSIPVAKSGQRSTSNWVYEQSGNGSYFTEVFENDVDRISEVFSFHATVRYKIPAGKFQFWAGLSPGTFSSKINFSDKQSTIPHGIYRETSLGLKFETGIDFMIKNRTGREVLLFTIFSDFYGPGIEEKMISLFNSGWKFINTEGNNVVNPVRLGFSLGIQ